MSVSAATGPADRSRALRFMLARLVLAITAVAGCASGARAADYRYLQYHDSIDVQEDGSYVETLEVIRSPLNRTAIDWIGQVDLGYSQNLADLDVLEAYVLKDDNRRVDVPADAIKLQDDPVSSGAPMFTDEKHRIIVFPDVEIDDRIVYRVRIHQREAYYPKHYLDMWSFPNNVEVADAVVKISVPAARPLFIDNAGFMSAGERRQGDRIQYTWRYENPNPPDLNTQYSVDRRDYGARLNVSTMKDYRELAKAYEARATEKAASSDAIKDLAYALTDGIDDRKAKARKLYDWVNLNIRYVATYIGAGGYVPHAAADVLRNRYGDCKDHVVLLESLLAVVGIESSTAIVNSDTSYLLPKVPSLGPFDHAITYLPEFDLYADSTHFLMPFGVIGARVADKPVIVTKLADPLRRTPPVDPFQSGVSVRTTASIRADGSIVGSADAKFFGAHSDWIRSTLADAGDAQMNEWSTSWLNESGLQGTSSLKSDDPFTLTEPFAMSSSFSTGRLLDLTAPGAFYIPESHLLTYSIKEMASAILDSSVQVNVTCGAIGIWEETTIDVPPEIEVLSLPPNVHEWKGALEYTATYAQAKRQITIKREFVDRSPHGQCTPAETRDQIVIATEMNRDLQRMVLFRPRPSL